MRICNKFGGLTEYKIAMKKRYWILLMFVIAVGIGYLIPNPTKSIDELYKGNSIVIKPLVQLRQLPLRTLAVNGMEWEYLVVGAGTKTILFLHGMGGAYDIWFQQINALQNDYSIISVTYPPAGSLKELAAGIMAILDREQVEKVNVVGSSLGGYLTQYLVAHHPTRIEKAVYGNTFPPNTLIREQYGSLVKLIPYLPEWLVMAVFRRNITKVYLASGGDELTRAYLMEQNYGPGKKRQLLARLKCVMDVFTPAASDNPVPVLIISSDNDNVVPMQLSSVMNQVYPNTRTHTFSGAGHFPYLNRPHEFTGVIRSFIEGQ